MLNINDTDPEKIKFLAQFAARQKRNARIMYIFAGVMLINSAIAAKIHETNWIYICGVLGVLDCYIADKCRKSYYQVRDALDEYRKKSR